MMLSWASEYLESDSIVQAWQMQNWTELSSMCQVPNKFVKDI